ncbi:MAG: hypothetical protein CMP62_04510 [Flavobacteriales bacterium]|nr:hypothetical protein [Flavobacteriales bacterium]
MKKKNTTEKQLANIEQGLTKTEQFIEDNSRTLLSIIGLIVFVFIASFGYKNLYQKPLNNKAQKQLFIAEQYFEKDSFEIALNGTNEFEGLIDIIDNYSNTLSGSLAKYYAGISYLNIGKYKEAIEILDEYKSNDQLLVSIAQIGIGDAFSELNQPTEAIEYYKQAIKTYPNSLTSPITLLKCANLYELEGDYENAIKCYESIKKDYPESETAKAMDKYINSMLYK